MQFRIQISLVFLILFDFSSKFNFIKILFKQVRSVKVLKEKYNNIKRTLRKTKENTRKELFLTGGGPAQKEKEKENANPVLDQLSDVMGVGVESLASR